jgi:hypothetical protein
MGKRTGQRVRAKAKDLSSGPDRATKVKGGQVKGVEHKAATAPKPVSITDGTSNTIMFGEVVHQP